MSRRRRRARCTTHRDRLSRFDPRGDGDDREARRRDIVERGGFGAANDDQVVGQPIELERLDIGERLCCGQTRNIRDRGMRPEIENHAIAAQHARASLVQAHLDGLRRGAPTRTHDQLGAARLVLVEVHRAEDHVALARQHSLHVDDG